MIITFVIHPLATYPQMLDRDSPLCQTFPHSKETLISMCIAIGSANRRHPRTAFRVTNAFCCAIDLSTSTMITTPHPATNHITQD